MALYICPLVTSNTKNVDVYGTQEMPVEVVLNAGQHDSLTLHSRCKAVLNLQQPCPEAYWTLWYTYPVCKLLSIDVKWVTGISSDLKQRLYILPTVAPTDMASHMQGFCLLNWQSIQRVCTYVLWSHQITTKIWSLCNWKKTPLIGWSGTASITAGMIFFHFVTRERCIW